ncbi:hypothetical protein FSARC_667, partial [Fusarium sarcochroum]
MKPTEVLIWVFTTNVILYILASVYLLCYRRKVPCSRRWGRATATTFVTNIGLVSANVLAYLRGVHHVQGLYPSSSQAALFLGGAVASTLSLLLIVVDQPSTPQALHELVSCIIWTLLLTLSSTYCWVNVVLPALYLASLIASLGASRPSSLSEDAKHPLTKTEFLSTTTLSWLDNLISLAATGTLSSDDTWPVDDRLSVRYTLKQNGLQPHKLQHSLSSGLLSMLGRTFRSDLISSSALALLNVASALIQPFFLQSLLRNNDMLSVAGLFGASMIAGVSEAHMKLLLSKIGIQLRSALAALIGDKCISTTSRNSSIADPAVLIEVDTTKVFELIEQFHMLWMVPLQASISLIILPILTLTTTHISRHLGLVMQAKDATVALTTQVLKQVKQIKLSALESIFERRIAEKRSEEMRRMKAVAYLNATMVFLVYVLPPALISITFGVAVILGRSLSSDVIFPALAFSFSITRAVSQLPRLVMLYQGAQISFGRIRDFLRSTPVANSIPLSSTESEDFPEFIMRNCDISPPGSQDPGQAILRDCNMEATSDCLLVISGAVGSGKTTLIRSIIGETRPMRGEILVHDRAAYAPQKPFLMSGTIRENILFGLPFDSPFYQLVLDAVSLRSDLSSLPDGDATILGGTGAALSGGQKSRVSIARAIYSRRKVLVFDDPLAALDVKVQSQLISQVFGPRGILKGSLRIVVTSSPGLMSVADKLYAIENGTVSVLMSTQSQQPTSNDTEASESRDLLNTEQQQLVLANYGSIKSSISVQIPPSRQDVGTERAPLLQKTSSTAQVTDIGTAPVTFETYLRFLKLAKHGGWFLVLLAAAASKFLDIIAVYYLKLSSEEFESQGHSIKLIHYSICAVVGGSLSAVFVLIAFLACVIPASLSIHAQLTKGVMESKFSFFDTTSLGQILNRFTNDINKIDNTVNSGLISIVALCVTAASSVLVVVAVAPLSLLYLVPIGMVYLMIQSYYLHACRQLRRLDNLARAPILNQAAEIQAGAPVILIFNQVSAFQDRLRDLIDDHIRVWLPFVSLIPWLTLRLQLLSSIIQLLSAVLLLWLKTPSSTLGLAMNFLIQITGQLTSFVQMRATLEADIISVERVWSYAANPSESFPERERIPASTWPDVPIISFQSYSASYKPGDRPCLRNLNFSVSAGEHVAVVGRTGAGKSSLTLALLRALDQNGPQSGRITIDNLDIASLSLTNLRKRITFMPQEPGIFAGTIRENLDLEGNHTDKELRKALDISKMSRFLSLKPGQDLLNYTVAGSGSNLSSGQVQLLALTRAILAKDSNILILDEATAAMDQSTTTVVDEVIHQRFKNHTILAITHDIKSA